MFMDKETRKSLDFQYIWNKIPTKTPYGKLYKDRVEAYKIGEEEELIEELEKVESYVNYARNKELMRKLDQVFAHIKDLRSSIKRASKSGILSEVELFEIKNFLHMIKELNGIIKTYNIKLWEDMKISPMENLEKLLDPEDTGTTSFYIYDSYSEELTKIRKDKRELEGKIKEKERDIKDRIEEELNLKLKPDGIISISKADKNLIEKIRENPNLRYNSETYMNINYSLKPTAEINLLEQAHIILKDQEEREEGKIKQGLSKEIGGNKAELFRNISSIGKIDFILGKAKFSLKINGARPEIIKDYSTEKNYNSEEDHSRRKDHSKEKDYTKENDHSRGKDYIIEIVEGRYLKVEESLKSKNVNFTPVSISLKQGTTCITGANMGGKTVSLKLVGLLVAMAQYGLMVPAKAMTLGLREFIKTSIGDLQSIDQGLSTFGGEVKLIQEAIEKSDKRGLILIDELARGTNPKEGYAISKAIVDYLKNKNSISLLTTHYDNIGNSEGVEHLQVIGLSHIDFKELEGDLKNLSRDRVDIISDYMDYRLEKVEDESTIPQEALNIARIMGLDKEVISLAEKNLD